jgi:ferredoxin-NADP reductase
MNAVFDHSEPVAKGLVTFWFKPEHPVRYVAGQFTELYLPHAAADSRGERRWFTLSSSPTEPLLAITTKCTPQSGSSFKRELQRLKSGAPVALADPMGDFVLPKDPQIPLVLIAAGAGITPMRSMIKYLQDTGELRPIHLAYAVKHVEELAFEPLFNDYGLTFTKIIKNRPAEYNGESGSLNTERILRLIGDDQTSLIYLAGPEPMVELFFKELKAKGVSEDRLVTDYFQGYGEF